MKGGLQFNLGGSGELALATIHCHSELDEEFFMVSSWLERLAELQ